jgi:hypothetical protein
MVIPTLTRCKAVSLNFGRNSMRPAARWGFSGRWQTSQRSDRKIPRLIGAAERPLFVMYGQTEAASYGTELTLLQLEKLAGLKREHRGAGLLFHFHAQDLESLAAFIERRDQTLTHFGFTAVELRRFACLLNGRGLDRIVPVGQALTFNRFWDGYDLLREMLCSVYIE